jgi:hypothetical protein
LKERELDPKMKKEHRPHIYNNRIKGMRIQGENTNRVYNFMMLFMEPIEQGMMEEAME